MRNSPCQNIRCSAKARIMQLQLHRYRPLVLCLCTMQHELAWTLLDKDFVKTRGKGVRISHLRTIHMHNCAIVPFAFCKPLMHIGYLFLPVYLKLFAPSSNTNQGKEILFKGSVSTCLLRSRYHVNLITIFK